MKIGINASFLRKQNTGIGQVTVNFLRKLMNYELARLPARQGIMNHEFFIYLEEDINFKLPNNFQKRVFLPVYRRDDLIRKIWWEKYLLPKKVREDQCDVFISLYQCPTVLRQVGVRPLSTEKTKRGRTPTKEYYATRHIMVVHDIIPKLFPEYLNNSRKKLYWNLTEKAFAKADKIIAISHQTEKDLVNYLGIDPGKITVNYIAVDEIYQQEVSPAKNIKVLKKYKLSPGYIYNGGGLEVRKNTEGVIRAYKILLERNRKEKFMAELPKLVISGKLLPQLAPLVTDAEKLVKELNLTQHVRLLNFVPQEDLPAIYKNCSLFVYPSKYEGFGMPVLEAMSQGKPVVASKKSSLPEVGSDSVLYCNPDDPEDIAMVMKNILTKEKLREDLKLRAKYRAGIFSWEKFIEKILNITQN